MNTTTTLDTRHLIIGAGPTGLGAAHRLRELGADDFLVLERHDHAGGLAASFTDPAGFTWDIGGHVAFSHYDYYDRLLDALLGDEVLDHQRIARIRLAGRWIPYPLQNNIRHLPREIQWECLQGLLPEHRRQDAPHNFEQWIDHIFGPGLARHFMLPYNFKVWATPPNGMDFSWIGERVSIVDLERAMKNIILEQDDVSWGPNNTFRFPLRGGTGEIFRRLAARVEDRILYNARVTDLDAEARVATLADGRTVRYQYLLSTSPLDLLVLDLLRVDYEKLRRAANALAHNGVHVAGVGVAATRDDPTCWMYFPEADCPFYRLTNFHNYSPHNVNPAGAALGFMSETSFSQHKPERLDTIMDRTLVGLQSSGMIRESERDAVVSTWEHAVDYGYPVPTLGRDAALAALIPYLESKRIFSRGRFGGWKYEVSNMDHSVMQGVEWAERMLLDKPETTYKVEQ